MTTIAFLRVRRGQDIAGLVAELAEQRRFGIQGMGVGAIRCFAPPLAHRRGFQLCLHPVPKGLVDGGDMQAGERPVLVTYAPKIGRIAQNVIDLAATEGAATDPRTTVG